MASCLNANRFEPGRFQYITAESSSLLATSMSVSVDTVDTSSSLTSERVRSSTAVNAETVAGRACMLQYRWMEEILHHYLLGFNHPRWCRVSSIDSMLLHVNPRNVEPKHVTHCESLNQWIGIVRKIYMDSIWVFPVNSPLPLAN